MNRTSNRPGGARQEPRSAPSGGGTPARIQYFTENGTLREDLVDAEAERQGRILGDVAPAQLRRYYEDVMNLRRRLEHEAANTAGADPEQIWLRLRPEFRMLRAKAYYANKRSEKVFTREFRDFIENHVRSVNTLREFLAFCRHFEAVVAFHKVYAKDRN
ncbi:MAG: type III-A CRISPR-associated protein Csm2 [Bryobacteraceae bacterium]